MIDTREYISNLNMPEKVTLFKELYNELAGHGIEGDTELAHVNTFEASLLKSLGGSGTINEITNLREYKGGGGSAPPPPPSTQTVTQTSEFPTELKPFVKDILGEAKGEFGREKAEGYQAFPGPQLAGFTPEQQAAFAAGRQQFTGLAGTPLGRAATYYTPALAATALGTAEVGPEDIQRRMDPFFQSVVDIAKRESEEDEDRARQQRAAKAVAGQGFLGGTRIPLVVEEQARQAQAQRLGDIQARGSSVAFQNALRAAEQQRQRELTGGRQFAALGDVTGARAREDIRGLAGTGEVQQARSQQALDIARREFEEEKAFPQTALQRYASIIRGFPLTPSQTTLATRREAPPSLAQSLTTAGLGAAGIYGMFGGFNPTQPATAAAGGLVSLQGGGQPAMNINMGTGGGYASSVPAMSAPQGGLSVDVLLEELARRGINRSDGGLMSVIRRAESGPLIGGDLFYNPAGTEGGGAGSGLHAAGFDYDPFSNGAPDKPDLDERGYKLAGLSKALFNLQTLLSQGKGQRGALAAKIDELPSEKARREEMEKYYADRRARMGQQKGYGISSALLKAAQAVGSADPSKGDIHALAQGLGAGGEEYGKVSQQAYEAEEAIAAQERGDIKAIPMETIQRELDRYKLMREEVTDKTTLFNLETKIEEMELLKDKYAMEFAAIYGAQTSKLPNIIDLATQITGQEYGGIEVPAGQKNAMMIAQEAWLRTWRKIEASGTNPGEAAIMAIIQNELNALGINKFADVPGFNTTGTGEPNQPASQTLTEEKFQSGMQPGGGRGT